jgi:Family of unknown function (DUF6012)
MEAPSMGMGKRAACSDWNAQARSNTQTCAFCISEVRKELKMLLHLCPRIYWPYSNQVRLVDFEIEPLGFKIAADELLTGRPYPNRHHKVACRKTTRNKMYNGLLVEIPDGIDEFTTISRWAVDRSRYSDISREEWVSTHHVQHRLLDRDFDCASEFKNLWYGTYGGKWSQRIPAGWYENGRMADPMMEFEAGEKNISRGVDTMDTVAHGWINARWQVCDMPTIERGRLQDEFAGRRMPPVDSAFVVG